MAVFVNFIPKGKYMLNDGIDLEKQSQTVETAKPLHPYTPTTDQANVCAPDDKECVSRLIAAFGDCA